MRKTTFISALSFCISLFCFITLGVICLPALAQDATPAAAPANEAPSAVMPSDPKELMLLAAKTNGLTGDDVKPWHLKATWKMLDEQGGITDQGTYEEYWVSPTKYKRTFAGSSFTKTVFGTDKGILLTGPEDAPPDLVDVISHQIVRPMQSLRAIMDESIDFQQHEFENSKLVCLSMMDAEESPFGPTWCLDADRPVLRIKYLSQGLRVSYDNIFKFQSRLIAGDLQAVQQEKMVFTTHLSSIEALAAIDEANFIPSSDAIPPKLRTNHISAEVTPGFILYKVAPDYPPEAKAAHVTGTVVLQATIAKDGRLRNPRVLNGPARLQQAALDAVEQWVYRPYLLNDEPIEIETTINVTFTLGKHAR
jgi:TonB family protein